MDRDILNSWISKIRNRKTECLPPVSVDVKNLIPHRSPMLLVDKIIGVSDDRTILSATRFLAEDDNGFLGHFPEDPVYPGVLLVETISQAGVCLLKLHQDMISQANNDDKIRALKLLYAEFLKEVGPNSELELHAEIIEAGPFLSIIGGSIRHKNEVCATTIVEVYIGS